MGEIPTPEKQQNKKLGFNIKVAEALGVNPQAVSNWRNRSTIPWSALFKFAMDNNLSLDWLIAGKERQHEPPLIIQETPRLKAFHRQFAYDNFIPIPLLKDSVAAGEPMAVNEQDLEGYCLIYADKEWMPNKPEHYTCCRVTGESMHPILKTGDIVAIDHSIRDPYELDKKMAAFSKNGGVTIKWLKVLNDGIVVGVPENKDNFDSVVYLKGKEINTGIIGKIAWWWAKR